MTQQLTQPAFLLATAFVPDQKHPYREGHKYGLVRLGTCYYVLLFKNPDLDQDAPLHLQGLPVEILQKRSFPQEPGGENEQGALFYRQRHSALAWFTDYFIRKAHGVLKREDEDRRSENNPFRAAISAFSSECHRPPEENEVMGIMMKGDANLDDRFLVMLDTFALRQIKHFEAGNEPPTRMFFEDQVRTFIELCVDEYWIPERTFEGIVSAGTTLLISILLQTKELAATDRAERLANELLAVIEPSIFPLS